MISQQPNLISLDQVTLVIDTVRLVTDGAEVGRDSRAAHFLHQAGIRHSFFPADKAGAAASFSEDEVFLLILGQHRRGQIRDFRFVGEEDKPMNTIDDGDVFVTPEAVDGDDMLVFECRSKAKPMKWFFHCLTPEKLAERKRKAAQPPPAKPPKPLPPPEEPEEVVTSPVGVPREPNGAKPVAPVETETNNAAGSATAPAQPQERNGDSMATKQPRSLIEYLILAFCESLKADPDVFATGVRGSGDVNSRVKEGVVFVARQLNVPWADISVGKGMPSASNAMTVFKRAEARYATGKNEFGRMVDAVVKAIPDQFMPEEKPGEAKGEAGEAAPQKSGPRKTRHPYKKRKLKGEPTSRPEAHPVRPAQPAQGSSKAVKLDQDLLVFLFWKAGATPVELSAKFDAGIGDIHRAVGRFTVANAIGDPDVTELVRLLEKIQARSAE